MYCVLNSSKTGIFFWLDGLSGPIASRRFLLPPARMRRRFCAPSGLPACSQLALEARWGSLEGKWSPSARHEIINPSIRGISHVNGVEQPSCKRY